MKKEITDTEKQTFIKLELNPQKVLQLGIKDLSVFATASPATIIRSLKKHGFSGYSDYKNFVKRKELRHFNNFSDEVNHVIEKNFIEVNQTLELLEPEIVENLVQVMNRAQTIYIYSTGTTTAIANYINRKLNLIAKPCINVDDDDLFLYYSHQIGLKDVILVLSQSGETNSLINAVKEAKKRGITIMLLTCGKGSRLHHLADYSMLAYKSPVSRYEFDVDSSSRIALQINARILLDCFSIYRNLGTIKMKKKL
ncbi:MAG: MurR/RpiR family transcriptional regulator [Streptococcaceae bacterium]|jgi:DNA-binding MurR/RpiR family transcriptional regulator|nr:MurR/RpiR family transcriptional regulator [Streptococcaceae bacterium]